MVEEQAEDGTDVSTEDVLVPFRVSFRVTVLAEGQRAAGVIVAGSQVVPNPKGEPEATSVFQLIHSRNKTNTNENGTVESELHCRPDIDFEASECEIAAYHPGIGSGYLRIPCQELKNSFEDGKSVEITLSRGRTLRGRVIDVDDQPVAGAKVQLDGSAVPAGGVFLVGIWAETKADGSFEIPGIQFENKPLAVAGQRNLFRGERDPSLPPLLGKKLIVDSGLTFRSLSVRFPTSAN